jgi:hypothetical protein
LQEKLMRIAYRTTDEVNQDLALEFAQRQGITLCVLEPRDPAPDGSFDAVLYDWDYWPAERKAEVLADLLGEPSAQPVAVHSYQFDLEQAEALRRRGIVLHRLLEPGVFAALRQAVLAARVATAHGRLRHEVAGTISADRAA